LDSTFSDLPQGLRDELGDVAQSFGIVPADIGLSGASPLRDILLAFANHFGATPLDFNGVEV
jgi:hypothetical protein